MCLVEVDGSRLMQPSCAMKTAPGMVIRTQTPRTERNRQFIVSLHLADTVADRETAEDNNPSRLFELADTYGRMDSLNGGWPQVDYRHAHVGNPQHHQANHTAHGTV